MPEPFISIVTPSFQQGAFLKVCVASVVMQGYPHVEHIVLDGGSTDGTADYLAQHPGCVTWWRSHRDGGQTQALNDGFARVTGAWVGWQNSDDFYYPGAFWRVAQIAANHPDIQVIAGDTAIVNEYGIKTNLTGIAPVPPKLWLLGHWPYNQSLFVRRDLLQQVTPLDESLHLHMDIEMFAKIAVLQPKIAYVNQPLGAFRRYEGIKTDSATWREQSLREQAALRERFHQQAMWPEGRWQKLTYRLRHHVHVLRRWGMWAIFRRLIHRIERNQQPYLLLCA